MHEFSLKTCFVYTVVLLGSDNNVSVSQYSKLTGDVPKMYKIGTIKCSFFICVLIVRAYIGVNHTELKKFNLFTKSGSKG